MCIAAPVKIFKYMVDTNRPYSASKTPAAKFVGWGTSNAISLGLYAVGTEK